MKKVLAIAVLLLAFTCSMAMASLTDWQIGLVADSPDGMNPGIPGLVGAIPGGVDAGIVEEDGYMTDFMGDDTTKWAQPVLDDGNAYMLDYRAPWVPVEPDKVWTFVVAGLTMAPNVAPGNDGIRLQFMTVSDDVQLPAPAVPGVWGYYLQLVDNRGKVVQKPVWAGGGTWGVGAAGRIPLVMPTTTDTLFGEIILPVHNLTAANTAANLATQGIRFQLIQGAIPEPSSLMALGAGLAGLVGLVARRRRV